MEGFKGLRVLQTLICTHSETRSLSASARLFKLFIYEGGRIMMSWLHSNRICLCALCDWCESVSAVNNSSAWFVTLSAQFVALRNRTPDWDGRIHEIQDWHSTRKKGTWEKKRGYILCDCLKWSFCTFLLFIERKVSKMQKFYTNIVGLKTMEANFCDRIKKRNLHLFVQTQNSEKQSQIREM